MKYLIVVATLFTITSAHAGDEVKYRTESNGAAYYLMKIDQDGPVITTFSRREGPSGVSYTLIENDCNTHKVRNVAEGFDDIRNLTPDPDPHWYNLVQGSSKSDLWELVCKRYNG